MRSVIVVCLGRTFVLPEGTYIREKLAEFNPDSDNLAGYSVNNLPCSLTDRLAVNCELVPIPLSSAEGMNIYRRTLCFILAQAANRTLGGDKLLVGHSLGDGYFYQFEDRAVEDTDIAALEEQIRNIVRMDVEIAKDCLSYADALRHFEQSGQEETLLLLKNCNDEKIPVYRCLDFIDLDHGPLLFRTGQIRGFELKRYEHGFLLRFPLADDPDRIPPFRDNPLLFSVYKEYKTWGRVLGVSSVGRLNTLVGPGKSSQMSEFIRVSEALHDKKTAEIAVLIRSRMDQGVRCVLIAGPSSSGKTTFAKKLSIMLRVLGVMPISIALDDYFLDRDDTPLDESGRPDFEVLAALDIELLNRHLVDLFDGKEVGVPVFDFKTGARRPDAFKPLRLPENALVLIEGIHGLNEGLTPRISRDRKFFVYVSALTQLNLDDHTRIPTTDNRLIRRMVRDAQFRGHSALDTLRMWPSVRRGEDKHIFPFQNTADAAFNSALDYELAVLKIFVMPLLLTVKPYHPEYSEAARLAALLDNFTSIPDFAVPKDSILREFIGGSEFKY